MVGARGRHLQGPTSLWLTDNLVEIGGELLLGDGAWTWAAQCALAPRPGQDVPQGVRTQDLDVLDQSGLGQ